MLSRRLRCLEIGSSAHELHVAGRGMMKGGGEGGEGVGVSAQVHLN